MVRAVRLAKSAQRRRRRSRSGDQARSATASSRRRCRSCRGLRCGGDARSVPGVLQGPRGTAARTPRRCPPSRSRRCAGWSRRAIWPKRRRCAKPSATKRSATSQAAVRHLRAAGLDEDRDAGRDADPAGPRGASAAGNTEKAIDAFARVVYEFPFSDLAAQASGELDALPYASGCARQRPLQAGARARRAVVRRQAVHAGAQAFESLRTHAQGDDRELVNLRLAEMRLLSEARAQRARRRQARTSKRRRGKARRCSSMPCRPASWATPRSTCGPCAASPTTSATRRGPKRRSTTSPRTTSSRTTMRRRTRRSGRCSRGFRPATTPSARRGRSGGGRTGTASTPTPSACSRRARRTFRDRTTVRRGCTGRRGRYEALGDTAAAEARFALVATDYLNTYYGRLAVKQLVGAPDCARGRRPRVGARWRRRRSRRARVSATAAERSQSCARCSPSSCTTRRSTSSATPRRSLGRLVADSGDARLDLAAGQAEAVPQFSLSRRHQHDEARVPAISWPRAASACRRQLLKVIFPVDYWDADPEVLGRAQSRSRTWSPRSIAQESTFAADIRSSAKAVRVDAAPALDRPPVCARR